MATSPITIAWASTTSNKLTIDATTQGNGIVFESDVVSNLINTALYINSQATRNLQIMGGYYDAGQDYKQYQYCSQLSYVGNEYVLNFYMATQDTPTLAPTNATTFQTNTTDMQVPINPTSVQSGWQQINLIPNQSNIAYLNKENHFTELNSFDSLGNSTLNSGSTLDCTNGALNTGGIAIATKDSTPSVTIPRLWLQNNPYRGDLLTLEGATGTEAVGILVKQGNMETQISANSFGCSTGQSGNYYSFGMNPAYIYFYSYQNSNKIYETSITGNALTLIDYRDQNSGLTSNVRGCKMTITALNCSYPPVASTQPYTKIQFQSTYPFSSTIYNYIEFATKTNYTQVMNFGSSTTISNASFGTRTFALDPEWEQDYATANYVNQKSLDLYEEIDARLSAIEEKLGIPKVASRGVDIKTRLASMGVAKSPITELFEKINNTQGYEGVLAQSNQEERLALSQARNDETEVMKIVNSIKDRIEREAKEREEAEAQSQKEQTQESSSTTRTRKKS